MASNGHHSNGGGHFQSGGIKDLLEVEDLETYALKNAENHRTEKYELVKHSKLPVLRRSAKFFLGLKAANRPADFSKDDIRVVFLFGPSPSVTKDTKVVLSVDPSRGEGSWKKAQLWDCLLWKISGQTAILEVQIASGAPVGLWKCQVLSNSRAYNHPHPFYILFNPFSSEDAVHYSGPASHLSEYVLNDTGKVYTGSYKHPIGRDWAFGQFEEHVLPAAVDILDKSQLRPALRGCPIKVSRAISALVNDVDDKGVLVGRWQPPYSEGTAPWEWSGSAEILGQYQANAGAPVKYGQCWVFSAVVTTICRSLGLPCRCVTNYVSAHDTNQSLTIDRFFSDSGDELTADDDPEFGYDSIWNFHVWNDVWMTRPDLPQGFGGWQAIDSTPQEASEGEKQSQRSKFIVLEFFSADLYQCGPAPLEAIRRGQVGYGYDVAFLFAEVNADVCHFVQDPKSAWGFSKTKTNTYHVGKLILTKAVGEDRSQDITDLYKYEEGSNAERLSVYNAVRGVDRYELYVLCSREVRKFSRALKYYEFGKRIVEDVHVTLEDIESVRYGDPFTIRLRIENISGQNRSLTALVKSSSIYNNGVTGQLIRKSQGQFTWPAGKRDALVLTVDPSQYMSKLVDYCMVKVYAVIRVLETNQFWSQEDDFILIKPKLKVEQMGLIEVGRVGRLAVSFINPLPVPLSKCRLTLDCPGVFSLREQVSNVGARRSFQHTVLVRPRQALANSTVVASFTSEEMIDVHGSAKLQFSNGPHF